MKNHTKQRGASRLLLILVLTLFISLLPLTLAACNKDIDIASIRVVDETVTQNVRVSDFDITKVSIEITDSSGNLSNIYASLVMLNTESKNKLKTSGEHSITLQYNGKLASFIVNLFEDDAELVTVTFKDKNNNEITTYTTLKGGSVTAPPHPIVEGMKADGWNDSSNQKVALTNIDTSIEIFAKYTEDIKIHIVTFKDYKGNVVDTVQVENNKTIPETPSYQQPEDIASWDWHFGNDKLNISSLKVTQNLTITMEVDYITHIVTFMYKDIDGKKIELVKESVNHNSSANGASDAITELKVQGYNFIEWLNSFNKVKMDLTVEAKAAINSYEVVFLDYLGGEIGRQTVNFGDNATPPLTPSTYTGHIFNGDWTGGSLTNVTQDLILTAVYELKPIAITIVDDGEQILTRDFGTIITADNLGSLKTKTGSILLGIYKDEDFNEIFELPYTLTTHTRFYTKWVDTVNGNSELAYSSATENTINIDGYNGKDAIIYIPNSSSNANVVGIKNDAFIDKNIIKVVFGENIKTIGNNAFKNTKLAGTVLLPEGLEEIGANAFAGCTDIESIIIPASVKMIGEGAFEGASKLSSIVFEGESQVENISERLFYGCISLTEIVLPNAIDAIGNEAFTSSGLTSINLTNVKEVGIDAFKDCQNLGFVNGMNNLETIKNYAFSNTAITNINLIEIKALGEYAFANNKKLVTVSLGANLSNLTSYTFLNCNKLDEINFLVATEEESVGLESISDFALMNCNNLRTINLPTTLESITADAFSGVLKLTEIIINAESAFFKTFDGVLYNEDNTELIVYPAGKIIDEYIIRDGTETIRKNAFVDTTIAKLVIAATINKLEENALNSRGISTIQFLGDVPSITNEDENEHTILNASLWKLFVAEDVVDNFRAIEEFDAAESTSEINNSFYDSSSGLSYIVVDGIVKIVSASRLLNSIVVPAKIGGKAVTHILSYAFKNCDNLANLQINANLVELSEYAFSGCTTLINISFAAIQRKTDNTNASVINLNAFEDTPWYKDSSLVIIADTAFEYKFVYDEEGEPIQKTSLTIPSSVQVIYNDLFNNEAGSLLETIILPQSLMIIRENAFKNSIITNITIPNEVYVIEKGAFEGCEKLKTLNIINSKISEVSERVFKGCSALEEIVLPSSVMAINKEAFMNCSSLIKITLPSLLTRIGDAAFKDCSSLPIISIPARVGVGISSPNLAYGNEAFIGCSSLVYVRIWNREPAQLGTNVFESSAYIYVESSDGSIISDYKTKWSTYENQILDQKDSPEVTFVIDKDLDGGTIKELSHITIEKMKTAVLYSAQTLPSVTGFIFVTWTYNDGGEWLPVEYPFLVPQSTIIKARWVRTDEGSLNANDLVFDSAKNGYIITGYSGSDIKVVIPAFYKDYPIIGIANNVFNGNDSISEIRFATNSNIEYIGEYTFANMTKLKSIDLPASVISIGKYAFASSNIETITIKKNIKTIEAYAFSECSQLDIVFEANSELRYTDLNAFDTTLWYTKQKDNDEANFVIAGRLLIEYLKGEKQNLVTIPANAVGINKSLFKNDEDIVTVELHSAIKFIGKEAFYNCSSLINIDFGQYELSKIDEVGVDAFAGTSWEGAQEDFVLAGTVLVRYQGTAINVEIPNGITVIDKGAFAYKAIETIRLPNNLKTIADEAFFSCSNLTSIEIPSQVTFIGKDAFRNNVTLKSITFLGNNIKEIGDRAFFGCTNLGTDIEKLTLVLPSSLTTLGLSAFEGCSALTSVNMTNTALTVMKERTFYGGNNLNTVAMPSSIEKLESNAFAHCTVLENITVGTNSQLKEINDSALNSTEWYNRVPDENEGFLMIYLGRVLLKYKQADGEKRNIEIPEQIKYIAPNAFENTTIASIIFPDGLTEIGSHAFAGCEYLTTITITDNVTKIAEYAFSNCINLETVYLGAGLLKLDSFVFSGSRNLAKIVVNRMGYENLTEDQYIDVGIAIEDNRIEEWFSANNDIFNGTDLVNINAFTNTSSFLRIYVVKENRNINIEIYRYMWSGVSSRIYNTDELPTVSFVHVQGTEKLKPLSSELLLEEDTYTTYNGYTLLGWEAVIAPEDTQGEVISFPYKVIKDTLLRPMWLKNDRPTNDTTLGFNYTPNASNTAYLASSYNSTRETMVIASKVNGNPLIRINDGVFTSANTASVKNVLITLKDNLEMLTANIFKNFVNLENITINGMNSLFVTVDGVLFTRDMMTLVAFPRALKANGEFVTEYTIPSSVVTILDYAFAGSKLKKLNIPSSVKIIGEGAFDNNALLEGTKYVGLSEIEFDENSELQNVAYGAFDGSAWYKNLDTKFRIAGSYLLSYVGFESSVTIPANIKTVGKMAFKNNDLNNIEELIVPASVVKINDSAFTNCSNIITIIFKVDSNLMDVANDVFLDTSWIDAMNIETSEFIIAGNVLIKYRGGLVDLPLPQDIKVIGYNAFNNARFSTIELHEGLELIDENAFFGCDQLTTIAIPASVKRIGANAFNSCLELNNITFENNSNLVYIGEQAFSYSAKLTQILIPDTVKEIGASAFAYCQNLAVATLNPTSQLTNLGERAFEKAKKLKTIFIPNGIKEIKKSTFDSCDALLTVNFSNENKKLTTIGEDAFKNCVVLGSDLEGMESLLTVVLPSNVNTIKDGAFSGNTNLKGIRMQGQILSIGSNAFYNCKGLSNVTIETAKPPVVKSSSFHYTVHPKLRVYVNHSGGESVLNAYKLAWGNGEIVASSTKIFERNTANLPLIQLYNIDSTGSEVHLTKYDLRAEFLSAANLPPIADESNNNRMSTGFFKKPTFESAEQVCTPGTPFEVVQDDILKLYVRWEQN